MTTAWNNVREALGRADSIAFDGCHKIYVLLDTRQTQQMADYGYGEDGSLLMRVTDPAAALESVEGWWLDSCGLRFISAVRTVEGDPNKGFTNLIAQGEADDRTTS